MNFEWDLSVSLFVAEVACTIERFVEWKCAIISMEMMDCMGIATR